MWKITGSQKREFQGQAVKSIARKMKKKGYITRGARLFVWVGFLPDAAAGTCYINKNVII
jgi:hypothetical protein